MKTLVIHAAALRERGEHMDRMLRGLGMDYEFIKEGDLDHLDAQLMGRFFKDGEKLQPTARYSCAAKHFLAYEKIVAEGMEGALVLEDDIVLNDGFCKYFEQSLDELHRDYDGRPVIISYEDSALRFVPRSQREKGRLLYPAKKGRMAGCYYINDVAAKAIQEQLSMERCDEPIDWYHNTLINKGVLECLWCQPTIATQGTFSGAFVSSLNNDGPFVRLRWLFKKNYKKLLYWLR